ncbi:MAG: 3-oxoacyl-ACP reductase FabG [Deltaproteobacteria bacterium]|nr:3-oxoacyl-ACP reductase FabG [Deltaproteobacteria bacterium]MBI3078963.1 3-oxoacyl-ACP reductase FabG [Deltaproteobacteria bacterium]
MRLKDKVAIVTGGAQGIGRFYCRRLAQEGAKVVSADVLNSQATVDEIKGFGGEAIGLHTDVTSEESTRSMAEQTVAKFGRIDILVNNAGLYAVLDIKPLWEISAEEWDRVMAVNVKGLFLCTKAVLPQMKKQGKGKIINISSGVAFKGTPKWIHYTTSKGAVISLTRACARQLGEFGIAVNAIAPGFTLSEGVINKPGFADVMNKDAIASRCFQRSQSPEDLVGTVVYLASDDSDFVTGQTIVVDGGSFLH